MGFAGQDSRFRCRTMCGIACRHNVHVGAIFMVALPHDQLYLGGFHSECLRRILYQSSQWLASFLGADGATHNVRLVLWSGVVSCNQRQLRRTLGRMVKHVGSYGFYYLSYWLLL